MRQIKSDLAGQGLEGAFGNGHTVQEEKSVAAEEPRGHRHSGRLASNLAAECERRGSAVWQGTVESFGVV
jgi:hypothetical protein